MGLRTHPSKLTRHGREKEPLVISLATKYVLLLPQLQCKPQFKFVGGQIHTTPVLTYYKDFTASPFARRNFTVNEIFPPLDPCLSMGIRATPAFLYGVQCPVENLPKPNPGTNGVDYCLLIRQNSRLLWRDQFIRDTAPPDFSRKQRHHKVQ